MRCPNAGDSFCSEHVPALAKLLFRLGLASKSETFRVKPPPMCRLMAGVRSGPREFFDDNRDLKGPTSLRCFGKDLGFVV